jgi:hypothetical protein
MTLAEKVSEVPKLYEEGNKSTARLLKDFGFPERRASVSVEDVEAVLRRRPRLAELWFKRRHDQVVAGGWSIDREDGHWRIQNLSTHQQVTVENRTRACAEFVVRYVAFIGEVQARRH